MPQGHVQESEIEFFLCSLSITYLLKIMVKNKEMKIPGNPKSSLQKFNTGLFSVFQKATLELCFRSVIFFMLC